MFPLINFEMGNREGSVASILLRVRGLMFHSVTEDIIKSVIKATNGRGEPIKITLNRMRAAKHKHNPIADGDGVSSLFGQTHELLCNRSPRMFKVDPPSPRVYPPSPRVYPPSPRVYPPSPRVDPPSTRVYSPFTCVYSPSTRLGGGGIMRWWSHEKYVKNMRKYANMRLKICDFIEDDSSRRLDPGIPIPASGKSLIVAI